MNSTAVTRKKYLNSINYVLDFDFKKNIMTYLYNGETVGIEISKRLNAYKTIEPSCFNVVSFVSKRLYV